MTQTRKMILEMGPLVAFFLTNWKFGIFYGTAVFMVGTLISLVITYMVTGKIAKFVLASAIFVGIFGGLTIYLHNDLFIKFKVTLANVTFAAVLFGGLYFNRLFLKDIMGQAMELPEACWRVLTIRWGLFFMFMAVLNEVVWRNFTTDQWVTFKAFGLMGLTLVFAIANAPYMAKHMEDSPPRK
ncbi:MAG: septation protein A [Alphaproteobacteria bacterium]|nr:septation protein A [Alphaproteobacteria bacterium]